MVRMAGHENDPPLDPAKADAELPGDEVLDEREAAGTDEWTRLDAGAGIVDPHSRTNWHVS